MRQSAQARHTGIALLLGIAMAPLVGNVFFGFACGAVLMAGLFLFGWQRRERHTGQRQAQQLLMLRAVAERAIRDGEVICCHHCQRPMRKAARRCLYCGAHRLEGPLR